jgi:hypothetical protein
LDKMDEPFTMIPNRVLRSKKLDTYDKVILCLIMSHGDKAFPSYQSFSDATGAKKERISKSLKKLEKFNLISRYKDGKKIRYTTPWTGSIIELINPVRVRFNDDTSSINEPNEFDKQAITSSIIETYKEPVIKNNNKEQLKREIFDKCFLKMEK